MRMFRSFGGRVRKLSFWVTMLSLGFFALAARVEGQSALPVWTAPEILGKGWWQSITVDRADTVHIVWYGSAPNGDDALMYTQKPLDGQFTQPLDVLYNDSAGMTVRNAIGVTSTGTLVTVYRADTDHIVAQAPATNAINARNWQKMRSLAQGYYLDLLVDEDDVVHEISAAYQDISDQLGVKYEEMRCSTCNDVIYRRSLDVGRTWTEPTNLTHTPLAASNKPDIWQGKSGRIYANWDEDLQAAVGQKQSYDGRFVYSDDGGITWSPEIILNGGNMADRGPIQLTMTELFDGSLMAVWRYSTDQEQYIYYQISDDIGETWTEPEPIPSVFARSINQTPFDDYELITDRTGVVYFFGAGAASTDLSAPTNLYQIEYRQGAWRPPKIIYAGTQLIWPEWPKAAVGPLNDIHLSWFIRRDWFGDHPDLEVYYAYRPGTLAAETVLAFDPTSTPEPTMVALPVFAATPTAVSTVAPMDANVRVEISHDVYASETLLAVVLVSVVLCCGVFAFQRFVLRR